MDISARRPQAFAGALGRTRWDDSLGSVYTEAIRRWAAKIEEHDALIASHRTNEAILDYKRRREGQQAAKLMPHLARLELPVLIESEKVEQEVWRPGTCRPKGN